ncbi:MAG: hypothetical protein ABNH00_12520 [Dokdonia sp.]|jgi:hypothetical protein
MKNDNLNQLWKNQVGKNEALGPNDIIAKAKAQRSRQYISIAVMAITAMMVLIYAFYFAFPDWNSFNLGLTLMISSLAFRIVLELLSLYRKEQKVISLTHNAYYDYLKKYYKVRLLINGGLTPICFLLYIYGFYLLLPYLEQYLSAGFYTYILISGVITFVVIGIIIVKSILKEHRFLRQLRD